MLTKMKISIAVTLSAALISAAAHAASCNASNLAGRWRVGELTSGPAAIDCQWLVTANGTFTGTCLVGQLGAPPNNQPVSGTLMADAQCNLTGAINSIFPTTTIIGGFVDGDTGYFTGVRDVDSPVQVRLGILLKDSKK